MFCDPDKWLLSSLAHAGTQAFAVTWTYSRIHMVRQNSTSQCCAQLACGHYWGIVITTNCDPGLEAINRNSTGDGERRSLCSWWSGCANSQSWESWMLLAKYCSTPGNAGMHLMLADWKKVPTLISAKKNCSLDVSVQYNKSTTNPPTLISANRFLSPKHQSLSWQHFEVYSTHYSAQMTSQEQIVQGCSVSSALFVSRSQRRVCAFLNLI